jgi:hypothetical protein
MPVLYTEEAPPPPSAVIRAGCREIPPRATSINPDSHSAPYDERQACHGSPLHLALSALPERQRCGRGLRPSVRRCVRKKV